MFRFIVLFTICVLFSNIQADYWFVNLETDIGVNMVRSLYRDHRGYLWIGNQMTGLMRYDGYGIKQFLSDPNDSLSLSDNVIYSIYEDSHNTLWVGTANGLNKYVPQKNEFVRYFFSEQLNSNTSVNFINKIVENSDSVLWVLTQNGIYRYNRKLDNFHQFLIPDQTSSNHFTCIARDKKGQIWCGTDDNNGLYLFNPEDRSFKHFDDSLDVDIIGNKTLFIDDENNFWYGHRGVGFAQFNPQNGSFNYFPISNKGKGTWGSFIYEILEVDSIHLFVGIDQGGINVFNRKTRHFNYITNDNPLYGNLSSNGIYCLHKDDEGIIWVGTSRGGVSYCNPKENRFKTYQPQLLTRNSPIKQSYFPSYGFHAAFYEDSKGYIWIGTDGGGINVFDRNKKRFRVVNQVKVNNDSIKLNVIRSVSEDKKGNFWILPWGGEILKYNPKKGVYSKEYFTKPDLVKLSANTYWSMFIDSKDRIWLTYTFGEVALHSANKEKVNEYFVGDSISYMDAKVYESGGSIFILSRNGIYRYHESKDTLQHIVNMRNIVFMDFDEAGNIWFASEMNGVYQCDSQGNLLYHNALSDDVYSFQIKALLYHKQKLYLSTNSGIVLFDIANAHFSVYTKEDRLQGNQFFIQSALKTKDGELFFGGNNGFSSFYPEKMGVNNFIPPVYITDLYVSNTRMDAKKDSSILQREIDFTDQIELNWKSKLSIELHFLAINYTFPNKNKYAYKLIGLNKDWIYTDSYSRKAIFTNLDPGEYIFQVKASNNSGVWNEEGRSLKIIITPPFWKTNWIYFIELLALIVFVYMIVIYREKQIVRVSNDLKRRVKERTEVIEKQKLQLDKQYHLLEDQNEELNMKQEELQVQNEELFLHRNNLQILVDEKTKDLIKAKERAEESDRLKSSFLANMSHEIRTPMNAIVGFSGLLEDESIAASERNQYVSMITKNCDVLLHLVEDILDFSLIESNQMKVNLSVFSVHELLKSVYESFALMPNNKDIEFRLYNMLESTDLKIRSDEYRIRQILNNLLSNSLKFTQKGYIEIGARLVFGYLEIYVKDTGLGMTIEEQNMIFKQFVKLDKHKYRNKRGIGLGLSISKRLAQLLNGDLTVKSIINEGSEFTLSIPL